ncbi:class I SAM-dependent DNA methyltransferase [Clostridium akagii]|uniref:class I SAM-dependent DNA methyltransferase n=1 Tax=Clostridium akagii TaxID=91623 RepID=UPI00047E5735|nr:class I SAM-dependent methyltransferase [Clostridium akagii]
MECYKDFAHIYDELIQGDVDYKTWGNVILDICKENNINFEEYLDLACGTGNMTKEIATSFKHTWGVDLSEDMLMEADKKLRGLSIKGKLVSQNICNLQLNRKFDLITCCLDSTNYILNEQEIEKYLIGVKNHLKEDGIFIFDINSYYKLSHVLGNNIFTYDDGEVVYIWENNFENEIVDMFLTFFVKDHGRYDRFDEEHSERAYTESQIEGLLIKCGFLILKKLNNYRNVKIEEDTERIVYIVKGATTCRTN